MPKRNYKFDIFKILDKITHDDREWIDTLSEDELKEIHPYVLQMWLKGANNSIDDRIQLMNVVSNPYIFSLGNHKKLLYKLLCVSNGFGIDTRCNFRRKNAVNKPTKIIKLVSDAYNISPSKAENAMTLLVWVQIESIAEFQGYQSDEIKGLKKEYEAIQRD